MTRPFSAGTTLTYDAGRIAFSGESGLTMPFAGALVIPRPAAETPTDVGLVTAQAPFVGIRFPRAGQNNARRFPQLRAMNGDVLEVTGPVLVLVAEDPGVFDEFDLGNIFSDGSVLTPQFPEDGALTSCQPKYIVLQLEDSTQVADTAPRLVKDGADLTELDGFPQADLSGTMMAFDFAGLEIEADAALAVLGGGDVTNAPSEANRVRVQLVDALGKPLPDEMIDRLQAKAGNPGEKKAFLPQAIERRLHALEFPDDNRELKLDDKDIPDAVVTDQPGQRFLWRGARAAIWPGRGAPLQPLRDTAKFSLNTGVSDPQPSPGFVRLCIYHPSQTMQTAYSGALDERGRFVDDNPVDGSPPSGMALAEDAADVKVFNDGESYFADFYKKIDAAGPGDRLYITNWATNAHVHMLGTLSRMGLGPIDVDTSEIDSDLALFDQSRIILPIGDGQKTFLMLADRLDRGELVRHGFAYETRRVSTPGVKDKAVAKGFVQPGGLYAFPFAGEFGTPFESRLIARWKDPAGAVHDTERALGTTVTPSVQNEVPDGAFSLGITVDDPPTGTLIRELSVSDIENAIAGSGGPYWVLVVNTTTGRHSMIDLMLSENDRGVVLGALPDDTSAADTLYAIVLNGEPGPTENLAGFVESAATKLSYTSAQHLAAEVPLAGEELGALLRRAIATGVELRALYWDKFLANIGDEAALQRGESNNQKMTALINTVRAGNRGFAIRDRATRAFGSFNQKGVVLVSGTTDIKAWLGGIDLALGRWDSPAHLGTDPDRQGGAWWDAQVRIDGSAAIDVLRNFAQRWWAIGEFIKDAQNFPVELGKCVPVDAPPEIRDDTQKRLDLPIGWILDAPQKSAASVQITRTCPPRSCHSKIGPPQPDTGILHPLGTIATAGELGSLAAFAKAIAMARRFVLINDQYFFSPEIALMLREALLRPDGPSFAVIVLPKDLSEFAQVDPMLFKVREKALHILMHGGTWNAPEVPSGELDDSFRFPHCGGVTANEAEAASPLSSRIAILHARNEAGDKVYVHSKHMIVDDVWMLIGSANLNYRSSTYDFELNASIVGSKLQFGGTDKVRKQRIELARRMLGLPAAYAPLISDPEAMFAQFKALEAKGSDPSHSLHPLGPMSQKLDPAYVKKTGDAAFDGNIDTVSELDMNDPTIDGLACSIIDPDGREEKEALAPFNFVATNSAQAYGKLILSVGCQTLTANLINGGIDLFVEVLVTGGDGLARRTHKIPLELQGNTVVPTPSVGDIWVPISTEEVVTILAQVIDNVDAPRGCQARTTIDPNQEIIVAGSLRDVALNLNAL